MAQRSIVRTAALVLVVTGLLALIGWSAWPAAPPSAPRTARASVVEPAPCSPGPGRDRVLVELLDGSTVAAQLDGCGHRAGEVLVVEVPDSLPADGAVVRLAGTGVSDGTRRVARVGALLLVGAGAAGALLAARLHRRSG